MFQQILHSFTQKKKKNKCSIPFMPIVNALFLTSGELPIFVDEEAEKTETAEKVEAAAPEAKTEAASST